MYLNLKFIYCILILALQNFYSFSQEIKYQHDDHLGFVENKGQWRKDVLFQSRFDGGKWWTLQNGFLFQFQDFSAKKKAHNGHADSLNGLNNKQDFVLVNFVGANKSTRIEKSAPSDFYYNYFIGNDKSKWASDVHLYPEATLKELYPGIDLRLIEQEFELKYEFQLAANALVSNIVLEYTGQQQLAIGSKGELQVKSKLGQIIENRPYSYQIINGKIKEVDCKFVLDGNKVSFAVSNHDPNFPLVIDPVLIFATYNGAFADNFGMTATYGHDGTAYSGGTVFGNQFPIPDSLTIDTKTNFTDNQVVDGITDVFITKYNQDGTKMQWSTFIGGGNDTIGTETVHSLICDQNDNVYLYGVTSSLDFPILNGFQTIMRGGFSFIASQNGATFQGGTDLYVAGLSSNGRVLIGSTYIGGTDNDGVNYNDINSNFGGLTKNYGDQFRGEIMLDKDRNIYVASSTWSLDFPVQNSIKPTNSGLQDGIIFKISSDFTQLLMSTYIGGSGNDACYTVKIDSAGFIVFGGGTTSTDIANIYTAGTLNQAYLGGRSDGFVGKLSPDGISSLKITFVGTANYDQVYLVEIDSDNKIYTYGQSLGGQFPVVNAAFSNPLSSQFILKMDDLMSTIERSTVFGSGDSSDVDISPSAFLVDVCGNIYISGWGSDLVGFHLPMDGMPVTPDAKDTIAPNGRDFYLMVLKREFDKILYGTYLGGNQAPEHVDGGTSRYDKNGIVYQSVCGGCWGYSDFPTTPGAWSAVNNGYNNLNPSGNVGCNNLIFKFDFKIFGHADFTASDTLSCAPLTINFQNLSDHADEYTWDFGDGTSSSTDFNPTKTYSTPGEYDVSLSIFDTVCPLMDTLKVHVTITPPIAHTISNDTVMCVPGMATFMVNSFGTAETFHWSSNNAFTDTLNASLTDSTLSVLASSPGKYYVRMQNQGCSVIDSVNVRIISAESDLVTNTSFCQNDPAIVTAVDNSPLDFTYTWSPPQMISQQLSPTSVQAITQTSGYIYADVVASNGCTFKDSILINVSPIFQGSGSVDASASDTIVVTGTEVTLTATPGGIYTYLWLPSAGQSNPNGDQTQVTVNQTTTFIVQITDGNCVAFDTVTVYCFSNLCVPPEVYVPNAFSPNEKGKNEKFYVRGPHIQEMLLRVYDRWGQMVFETTDYTIGWDGTYKERKLDPDVYDYYLKVTCIGGHENIIKGNVTLLK